MKRFVYVVAFSLLFGPIAVAQTASEPSPIVEVEAVTATPPVIASSPEAVAAAGEDTSVTIEWGNLVIYWVKALQVILTTLIVGVAGYLVTWVPGIAGVGARMVLANFGDKLIRNAIAFAVNAVEGAVKDKKMDVQVGSAVLATAVERILQLARDDRVVAWVVKNLGGIAGIQEKVFRNMEFEPEVAAHKVLSKAPIQAKYPLNRG